MQITEIRSNVFACLMANETSNAGFIVTDRGVIVIDTLDKPARGRQFAATIEAMIAKPVLFVINTHHHYDHIFGNQAFDAPVIAHNALAGELVRSIARDLSPLAIAARIADRPEDRWLADELEVIYPTITFERRLTIDLDPVHIVLQHLGGHTPDALIVDLPDEGILFSGDLLFEGRVPSLRQAHIEDTLRALRYLEALEARIVVPGYGQVCSLAYVTRYREYLESLRGKVEELILQGWEKGDVLDSEQLPTWWTGDRPTLLRANVARVYDGLVAGPATG
jgi:glyoxylase-like metal-dependent hydrolase (beta-lactamase superfamily II)